MTPDKFSKLFQEKKLSSLIVKLIEDNKMSYDLLNKEEQEKLLIEALKALDDIKKCKPAGKNRIDDWENGWAENLNELNHKEISSALTPKYWGKTDFMRWSNGYIRMVDKSFEKKFQKILVAWIVEKYCKNYNAIYEFGCGTAQNLVTINEILPNISLHGLDWASSSQNIIQELNKQISLGCQYSKFDFFNPNYDIDLSHNDVVMTVTALEQVGNNFEDFLSYLLAKKPGICIHLEPIVEFLEPDSSMMDQLMFRYARERNYLNGYYTALRKLEANKKIDILDHRRIAAGSFLAECYSVLVWRCK